MLRQRPVRVLIGLCGVLVATFLSAGRIIAIDDQPIRPPHSFSPRSGGSCALPWLKQQAHMVKLFAPPSPCALATLPLSLAIGHNFGFVTTLRRPDHVAPPLR